MNVAKKTILHQETSANTLIVQLMEFANKARKEGILALQGAMEEVGDDFLKKAMQMAVDGQEPDTLRSMLNTEIEYIQVRHGKGAEIFTSIAAYAPAMGMVGTLIGLVQMLQTMDDPASIGPAMAVALLTTFYGAVIANVVCSPMAGKLKNRSASEVSRVGGSGSPSAGLPGRCPGMDGHLFRSGHPAADLFRPVVIDGKP